MPATVNVTYGRYSDNLALTASAVSVDGGTVETGYSVEWIRDVNAARPVRLSTKQGMFKFQYASRVAVPLVAILHANYAAASTIYIEGNDTDSWATPSFQTTITWPAWRADRFPPQPWKDLRALAGYGTYYYWRAGTKSDNSVNVSVGEIWLQGTFRQLDPNIVWGGNVGYDRPQVERATAYRRLRIPLATTRRRLDGDVKPTTDAGAQDIIDWFLDANGRPVLLIPDGTLPEAWMALHTVTLQQLQQAFLNNNVMHLGFEEDGRGLEPTPTPLP